MFNAAGKDKHILGLILIVVSIGLFFCFNLPSFSYAQDVTYPSPYTTSTYTTPSNSVQLPTSYPPPISSEKSLLSPNSDAFLLTLSNPVYIPVVFRASPCYDIPKTANYQAGGYTMPPVFLGGEVEFPEKNYVVADLAGGGFVLNGLWNFHANGDFEEIGFSKGWGGYDTNQFYVAWSKSGVYDQHKLLTQPSGYGTAHKFAIFPLANSDAWKMMVDYEFFLITMGPDDHRSLQLQVGGEMTSPYSTMEFTPSSSLKYYFSPEQGMPEDWPDDTSFCDRTIEMDWAWMIFPTYGIAWSR
jgi:hypothetical protein